MQLIFITDSGLDISHLSAWLNSRFLRNSQLINFLTQSCLLLNSFRISTFVSNVKKNVSSPRLHNLHLLFCVSSIFILIKIFLYFSNTFTLKIISCKYQKSICDSNILSLFYHLEYSDNCLHLYCYTHNVSVDMSFGLLQVLHINLGSQQRIIPQDT